MQEVRPQLRAFTVESSKLLLDPNNPRFVTSNEEKVPYERIADPAVVANAFKRMLPSGSEDPFRIHELISSIEKNGWQSIDSIFVRKYQGTGFYVVLEGNRRVTAIQELLSKEDIGPELQNSIKTIEVMEVLGEGSHEEFDNQVAYLLGVRHHGALKKWSPFAQARNILKTYVETAQLQSENEFSWNDEIGSRVGDSLSISVNEVRERLGVYRAMNSVSSLPEVGPENMKDRYYSLFKELLTRRKGALASYIEQDTQSFDVPEASAQKINKLCRFDAYQRQGSAIANPQEWRFLSKLLSDEDDDKRRDNILRVEKDMEQPSVVWAQRAQELKKLEWSRWLESVSNVLARVQLGAIDLDDVETRETVSKLVEVINTIQQTLDEAAR